MNSPVPIPAPIPLPAPFVVPSVPMELPSFQVPEWEPVPVYREDVPALNPQTAPEEKEPEDKPQREMPSSPPMPTPPTPELPALPGSEIMNTIELPGGYEVPVPPKEIVVTAVTTAGTAAVVSVGATMAAGRVFEQVVKIAKPIIKTVLKKIAKLTGRKPPQTWARARLAESHQRIRDRKRYRGGS